MQCLYLSSALGGCAGPVEHRVAMATPVALPEPAVRKRQPRRCLREPQSVQLMQGRPALSHDQMATENTPWEGYGLGFAVL